MNPRILSLLCLLPATAFAQSWDVSYDYIEIGYTRIDVDVLGTNVHSDGFGFEVSGGGDHVHAFAGYSQTGSDNPLGLGIPIDGETSAFGIGGHFRLSTGELLIDPALSLFARVGYARSTASMGPVAGSGDGVTASFGVRAMPGPKSEFRASVERFDGQTTIWLSPGSYFTSDTVNTSLSIGGRLYLSDMAALILGYDTELDADTDSFSVGIGFYFGGVE